MGCGNFFFSLVITLSVALITYNIIISANAPLKSDFPGPSSNGFLSVDPIIKMPADRSRQAKKRLFHTAVTSSDSVYNTWQCRIMYYWFKQHRGRPGSEMGGFTRILHSGKPDGFMDEIPTFVAQPLPNGMDQGYIVLNRPWAFVQWLQKADIKEDYILMAEPDHIIVKPIPNLSKDGLGAAFPFFYIEPKKYESVLRKFFPEDKGPITNIDPIGNSPVIVGKESLKKIAPTWMNISLAMKKDPEADKKFGWVLEMYAYAVASALHGVGNILYKDFMIQTHSPQVTSSDFRRGSPEVPKPPTTSICSAQAPIRLYEPPIGLYEPLIGLYEPRSAQPRLRLALRFFLLGMRFRLRNHVSRGEAARLPAVPATKPPWDKEIGNKFIIHYTYGCDYDMQGNLTYGKIGEWRFDKRSFDAVWPPKNLPLPPPGVPESVVTLVKMVNEATANIPNWGSS
ncbi:hypothetical protein Acr_25g0011330 [Actinidia rufa]|uniref:Hydroxyproline O-arabinosyltransferase-like domain-containing protein n=1 Tax=Actinidia rufa TaxID=165716 RepID=A0A7J0H1S1_9ERIC|nr:hypothetical protein Acr_25g0011330 [Actinidia rufa]